MDKKNYKLIGLFCVLVAIVAGAFFYYFKIYKKNLEEPDYHPVSDSLFLQLKDNPDYLVKENLIQINSLPLLEFFRTRMLFHTYTNPGSPRKNFIQELERDFPGERSKVLVEILDMYLRFEKEKQKVAGDKDLDDYEKILKVDMLRFELFGEKLVDILFTGRDFETVEKFYAYSNRYLKKHYPDMPRSKKNHLIKARKEIYGEDYERLFALESFRRQFELELKINERELGIMNEFEKQQAIEDLKVKMKNTEN